MNNQLIPAQFQLFVDGDGRASCFRKSFGIFASAWRNLCEILLRPFSIGQAPVVSPAGECGSGVGAGETETQNPHGCLQGRFANKMQ